MAPYVDEHTPLTETKECGTKEEPRAAKYRYTMIAKLIVFHGLTLYTIVFKLQHMMFWTFCYTTSLTMLAVLGTTAGAHRMWTHRSFKATWPLRLFLFFCFTLQGHLSIHQWVLKHRVHHKFTDTEADPHNSRRGFFFSHIGWLMMDKTPECRREEKKIDMSDILSDPLARFHSRFFYHISWTLLFLPSLIPVLLWKEDPILSILTAGILRYALALHIILCVNSFAHMYGSKPYNKRICPTDGGLLSFIVLGEAWHNYHHTFPWDYKAAEFGDRINMTARFLDLCAKLGLAYDLKTASPLMVASIKNKYGDGSHNH